MISAPRRVRSSGPIALTVPAVPTAMNAGVSTVPCGVFSRPRRARVCWSRCKSWNSTTPMLMKVFRSLRSCDQHRIAVGKEAIATGDGFSVGAKQQISSTECTDHDNQRQLRKMEVREERLNHPKLKSRTDEEIGFVRTGSNFSGAGLNRGLERSNHGGADRHHSRSGRLGGEELVGGLGRYFVPFQVHLVLFEILHAHRKECTRTDFER